MMRVVVSAIVMIALSLLLLAVPVFIGVYVYRDATRRGMNGVLWTLVAIFAPSLIGLIIYLIVRGNYSDMKCSRCGTSVTEQYVVCPKCGAKLRPSCPGCAAPVEPDWRVCPRCARPLPGQYPDLVLPQRPKDKTLGKILIVVILVPVLLCFLLLAAVISFRMIMGSTTGYEEHTDIAQYNDYIGEDAVGVYQDKWIADESIFPAAITADMDVADFKMVYYDSWDAQFLAYLVVDYTDAAYPAEVARLERYDSTEYLGNYGVTGFAEYDLLAIYADDYGFVYALTDQNGRIIYVELIFANYFMEIDYQEEIAPQYLPDGLDALRNNAYCKKMLGE